MEVYRRLFDGEQYNWEAPKIFEKMMLNNYIIFHGNEGDTRIYCPS